MIFLNLISLIGVFGLCAIAWLLSENRDSRYFPWRIVSLGLGALFGLGAIVSVIPETRAAILAVSYIVNVLFDAADAGARFIFGKHLIPAPGQEPFVLIPLLPDMQGCPADSIGQIIPSFCAIQLGYIFILRALPAIVFFAGMMAILYRFKIASTLIHFCTYMFYRLIHMSGVELVSGVVSIFTGIESIIAVKPYLTRLTRSELCTILACGFGTASLPTLAIYAHIMKPAFPNVWGHLLIASVMAVPACFVLSKILVPETKLPPTVRAVIHPAEPLLNYSSPSIEDDLNSEAQASWMEAAILGALTGIKVAAAIVAVLILLMGMVYLLNQLWVGLALLPQPVGPWFQTMSLPSFLGVLFLPFTALTGISLDWNELWQASILVGRRFLETPIPPYQALLTTASVVGTARVMSDRAVLILTYLLSGFASVAAIGVLIGGTVILAPSRRREIIELGWKALVAGTLATFMVASVAGFYVGLFGTTATQLVGR